MTVKMGLVLILNLWKKSWILEIFNAFSYRISGLILLSWKQKNHLGSKLTLINFRCISFYYQLCGCWYLHYQQVSSSISLTPWRLNWFKAGGCLPVKTHFKRNVVFMSITLVCMPRNPGCQKHSECFALSCVKYAAAPGFHIPSASHLSTTWILES